MVERAVGSEDAVPGASASERVNATLRRSLFVVQDVAPGAPFTPANVRAIRPGAGLPPKHLDDVIGRRAAKAIPRGTPLQWDLIAP